MNADMKKDLEIVREALDMNYKLMLKDCPAAPDSGEAVMGDVRDIFNLTCQAVEAITRIEAAHTETGGNNEWRSLEAGTEKYPCIGTGQNCKTLGQLTTKLVDFIDVMDSNEMATLIENFIDTVVRPETGGEMKSAEYWALMIKDVVFIAPNTLGQIRGVIKAIQADVVKSSAQKGGENRK